MQFQNHAQVYSQIIMTFLISKSKKKMYVYSYIHRLLQLCINIVTKNYDNCNNSHKKNSLCNKCFCATATILVINEQQQLHSLQNAYRYYNQFLCFSSQLAVVFVHTTYDFFLCARWWTWNPLHFTSVCTWLYIHFCLLCCQVLTVEIAWSSYTFKHV